MTITAYSSAIVDTMLGWLKGLANWVLRLFNLAGGSGVSPLLWLSQNWLKLLIVFMIIGVAGDVLVWLVRWRPHWVWFGKERVIVEDENFFNDSDIRDELELVPDDLLEKNWQERDYVVASTVVGRRARREDKPSAQRRRGERRTGEKTSIQRGEKRRRPATGQEARRQAEREERVRRIRSEREKDLFGTDGSRPGVTDLYEDEVFNVNNLPDPGKGERAQSE